MAPGVEGRVDTLTEDQHRPVGEPPGEAGDAPIDPARDGNPP